MPLPLPCCLVTLSFLPGSEWQEEEKGKGTSPFCSLSLVSAAKALTAAACQGLGSVPGVRTRAAPSRSSASGLGRQHALGWAVRTEQKLDVTDGQGFGEGGMLPGPGVVRCFQDRAEHVDVSVCEHGARDVTSMSLLFKSSSLRSPRQQPSRGEVGVGSPRWGLSEEALPSSLRRRRDWEGAPGGAVGRAGTTRQAGLRGEEKEATAGLSELALAPGTHLGGGGPGRVLRCGHKEHGPGSSARVSSPRARAARPLPAGLTVRPVSPTPQPASQGRCQARGSGPRRCWGCCVLGSTN